MYLLPGSKLECTVEQRKEIPPRFSSLMIQGFTSFYVEGKGYHHLCQHYAHDEVDLYIYHIHTSARVELFSKSTIRKWCLGYVKKGHLQFKYSSSDPELLVSPEVLFFPTEPGHQLQLLLEAGDYTLYCCCFTANFSLFIKKLWEDFCCENQHYPILLPFIDYSFQLEWDRLVQYATELTLYPAFLAAQIRLLLAKSVQCFRSQVQFEQLLVQHPGLVWSTIQKAYMVRDYIEAYPSASLDLPHLCKVATWNLQGLKTGFFQVFGIPPHQYIIRYRLQLAASLLQEERDMGVQAVALSCGYRRVHHFIQVFKKTYGCTPGVYKDQFWKSKP